MDARQEEIRKIENIMHNAVRGYTDIRRFAEALVDHPETPIRSKEGFEIGLVEGTNRFDVIPIVYKQEEGVTHE